MVRGLYGLNISGAYCRTMSAETLRNMDFFLQRWLIQKYIVDRQGSLMVKTTKNY